MVDESQNYQIFDMNDSSRAVYLLDKELIEGSRKSPLLLQISGNSYTILEHWRRGVNRGDYRYLRINVSGTGVQSFNFCLFYWLIGLTVILFFPIFLFISECVKRKLYMLFAIDMQVYSTIGKIITAIDPRECYLVIQDNYFNEAKSLLLLEALKETGVKKFELVNIAKGVNVEGNNYSDFSKYMKPLKSISKSSSCRWSSKSP